MSLTETIRPQKFHTFFMFPFRFDDKFDLKKLKKIFKEQNKKWDFKLYEINRGLYYNEYLYFYPHIRKILFSNMKGAFNKENRVFFQFKKTDKDTITYSVLQDIAGFELSLTVKDIFLHFFEGSTGLLAIEILHTNSDHNLKQYLQFLDYGRRIYLSFINPNARKSDSNKLINLFTSKNDNDKDGISAKQCASKIILTINEKKIETDFRAQFKFDINKPDKHYLSQIIRWLLDAEDFSYEKGHYYPIVDDRMYTHTYYDIFKVEEFNGNDKFLEDVKAYFKRDSIGAKITEGAKSWYQMIFIDSDSPAIANDPLFREILDRSTYKRWIDWGTIYGFSRYSSATISDSRYVPFIEDHYETMYYQIALLLFFYRGSLLSFFDRTVKIAEQIDKSKPIKKLQKLHEDFILFENKYWFKEVTAQDQGIEMFDIWEKQMRLNLLLDDVKQGIRELYNYFDYQREKRTARYITLLTILGGILLPLSIVVDIIASNDFQESWLFLICNLIDKNVLLKWLLKACLITPILLLIYYLSEKGYLKFKNWKGNILKRKNK